MMMLSRTTTQFAALARRAVAPRAFTTVAEAVHTAEDALKFSGYSSIDFTIAEDLMVYDAVQKFAAFNIGCLVTTDKAGEYSDGDEWWVNLPIIQAHNFLLLVFAGNMTGASLNHS
jgi:hypothetical protein